MMNNEELKKFGFTRKILDDFQDFASECVSFQRKINNPFCFITVFQKKKCQFSLDVKQNTHFTDENQPKKSTRSAPLTIIILLE